MSLHPPLVGGSKTHFAFSGRGRSSPSAPAPAPKFAALRLQIVDPPGFAFGYAAASESHSARRS